MVELTSSNNKHSNKAEISLDTSVTLSSFESFKTSFPLQGQSLYRTVFDRNTDVVQTQKPKVAIANLEKVFNATFDVSATSGFDRMSLRDLSRKTGMSMGAIYSCISKKEDIAIMVADIVRLSSELTRQHAQQSDSLWVQIEQSIRYHLYASTLLQSWYFFLYFETRSLPEQQQKKSKRIELDAITAFEQQIKKGIKAGEFSTGNPRMVANTIVVLLEDWYLKPWKTQSHKSKVKKSKASDVDCLLLEQERKIDTYHQSITGLVKKLLTAS